MLFFARMKNVIPALVLLTAAGGAAQAAEKYNPQHGRHAYDALTNPSVNVAAKVSPIPKKEVKPDGYWQHMTSTPKELPGMALPQGAKSFGFGISRQNGKMTEMRLDYRLREPAQMILSNYKAQFAVPGSGWVMQKQTSGNSVSAVNTKLGNSVNIQTRNAPGATDYSTNVAIFYTMKNQ